MSDKVTLQESKEYQIKVDLAALPASDDDDLFRAVSAAIRQAVASVAHGHDFAVDIADNGWQRDAIRYDTADRTLKRHCLTLAIEATDERTKLKCKEHNFIPELLFQDPKHAFAYPDIDASGAYKKHDSKLKREQDIHLDNLKYCASGSLFVKGRQTDVRDSSFFTHYFRRLDEVLPETVPLVAVSHWNETIYDDMRAEWKHGDIDTWMLVNRRDAATDELLESELSFKAVKALDDPWRKANVSLEAAGALYLALRDTGLFMQFPPIFTFADPVSSIDIQPV